MTRTQMLANVLASVSEAEFQAHVVKLATVLGWRAYHTHDSRRSAAGFPDLVLVRRRDKRIIFAELKTKSGKVRAAQAKWLNDLEWCGAEVYVWRPGDEDMVRRILQSTTVPQAWSMEG